MTGVGGDAAFMAAALDVLFDNSTLGIGFFDEELRFVRVNQPLADMNGKSVAEHLGRRLDDILPPDEIAPVIAYMRTVLESGRPLTGVEISGNGLKGYGVFECSYYPIIGPGDARARGVVSLVANVTEARLAERRLSESEMRLRNVLDASLAYIGVIDAQGRLEIANAPALVDAGLTSEDTVGRAMEDTYWFSWSEEVRARARDAVRRAFAGELVRYIETVRFGPETRRRLIIQITPVFGGDGRVAYLVPTGMDVTELAEAQERQELLTAELNHRVKNIFSIVRALVRGTARRAATKDALAEALEGRIGAMARSVALLNRSSWTGYDLGGILKEQVTDAFDERVRLTGPALPLSPKAALAFALIGYELVSNAAKYGALSVPGGRIEVSWAVQEDRLHWLWREIGGPRVEAPGDGGFGSVLLRSIAQGDLDASLTLDYEPTGVKALIEAPMARIGRAAKAGVEEDEGLLNGVTALIAEDSAIVAMEIASALEVEGALVVGPFSSAAEALAVAQERRVDVAFLSARIAADEALVTALSARGAALVAITGKTHADLPPSMALLPKPFVDSELIEAALRATGRVIG